MEKFLDTMIKSADAFNKISISHTFYEINKRPINEHTDSETFKLIGYLLTEEYKYAVTYDKNAYKNNYVLIEEGKKAKSAGGHFKYQSRLETIRKKELWKQTHPFLIELRTIIITAVVTGGISILISLSLSRSAHQSQYLIDTRQDSVLKDLGDSLKMIQLHK